MDFRLQLFIEESGDEQKSMQPFIFCIILSGNECNQAFYTCTRRSCELACWVGWHASL